MAEEDEGRLLSEDEIGALLSSLSPEEEAPAEEEAPPAAVAEAAPPPAAVAEAAPAAVAAPAAPAVVLPPMPRDVKPYDFRRPERLSQEHLRTLGSLHDGFAELVSAALSGLLRTSVELEVKQTDQSSYAAYVEQATEGNLYHIVALEPLPGDGVLEVSSGAGFALLERLLGGSGRSLALQRKLTTLEGDLFKRQVAPHILENLREAWSGILEVRPAVVGEVMTNPSLLQITLPSDAVAVITLSGRVAEVEATVRLCFPHTMLEPIMPQLSATSLFRHPRQSEAEEAQQVRQQLSAIKLPVIAELGATYVTVEELLGLQAGDVIRLDSLADEEVSIRLNVRPKYRGRPGRVKSHLAVRVTEALEDNILEDGDGGNSGS